MRIRNGIIFIWSGTHALIPSGWSRVNSFDDGKFPKGTAASTDPNTTGGTATHTHTVTGTHTHTMGAHTHTITIPNGSGGIATTTSSPNTATAAHNHGATITSGAAASTSVSSVTPSYGAFSNNPPFYSVIYITPTTSATSIPAGVIGLADAAAPAGFNICDGTASTPNLVDKYLNGAATGADAGTTGGTTTNTHTLPHVHTTSHTHSAATSGSSSNTSAGSQASGGNLLNTGTHTHSVDLDAATPSTADNITLAASAETVEPAYTKLLAIQAAGVSAMPVGIIALWTGTLATIPSGWILCDGNNGTIDMRDRHLKITGTVGDVGDTGGSNTHTHASQNHSHTLSHSHTKTLTHSNTRGATGSGTTGTNSSTTHAVTTDSADPLTGVTAATSADSSNNEPTYRTVAYIKLSYRIETSPFIFNFIANI